MWDKPTIQLVEGRNLYLEYNGHKIAICGLLDGGGIRIMPLNGGIAVRPRIVPLSQFQVRLAEANGSAERYDERKITTCLEIEPLGLHWDKHKERYTGG